MSRVLRWGILGTGVIAHTFARALAGAKRGALAAVGSRSQESAETFGAEFGLASESCHASYENLLADAAVDAVYIATPHPLHAEWAMRAAASGKHVLCEKPLTLNHATAQEVVAAARRHDVFLMEAFMYRCHPQTAKIVELIRSGVLGEVRLIQAGFAFNSSPLQEARLFNNAMAGGGILDVGCYPISMARLVAGVANGGEYSEPLQLKGVAKIGASSRVDEVAAALLLFPAEIVAQCTTGIRTEADNTVRIFGSRGALIVPNPWLPAVEGGATKLILRHGDEETGRSEEIVVETSTPLYAWEADAFAEGVETGCAPFPAMSPDDTLGNMRALDAWRREIGLVYDGE